MDKKPRNKEWLTSIIGGKELPKSHPRIAALGDIDELNSVLGVARSFVKHKEVREILKKIQAKLFTLGTDIATPKEIKVKRISSKDVKEIEKLISIYQNKLREPKDVFVFPSGCEGGEFLHLARTVCRRAERSLVKLKENEWLNINTLSYINKLSNLLYVLARYINQIHECEEIKT